MGLIKNLKNINAHIEEEDKKFSGGGDKAVWFKLDANQAVTVQFLQELDEDSENYSEKNGTGILAVEHSHPNLWKNTARCTADEGDCWACEQHNKDYKAGWRQKNRLYINALVDDGVNDPFVAILAQGLGPKSITPALIEIAGDLGTITDTLFKIKRTGKGKGDTSYTLTQRGKTENDVEQYELFDLEKASRLIEYDEQEKFYNRGSGSDDAPEKDLAGADASSSEW